MEKKLEDFSSLDELEKSKMARKYGGSYYESLGGNFWSSPAWKGTKSGEKWHVYRYDGSSSGGKIYGSDGEYFDTEAEAMAYYYSLLIEEREYQKKVGFGD